MQTGRRQQRSSAALAVPQLSSNGGGRRRDGRHSQGKDFFLHGHPRTAIVEFTQDHRMHRPRRQRPKALSLTAYCTQTRVNTQHATDYRILLWNLRHALCLVLLNWGSQWTPGSGDGNRSPESPHPKPVGFNLSRKLSSQGARW